MSGIKSYFITEQSNSKESNEIAREFLKSGGLEPPPQVNAIYFLFKVEVGRKYYFCCISGGEIIDNKPSFTFIGERAFDALINLRVSVNENKPQIIVCGISKGRVPLRKQIISTLLKYPSGTKVCFIGDMVGELDGIIMKAFNVQPKRSKGERP